MKDMVECRERLKGLFNITVTPFDENGLLDEAALAQNINRIIDEGFDGILIGGTYGEFPAMSTEERVTLFRSAMNVVGDRVPVMLCTAAADVRTVRELTQLASDLGGLPMITPPFVSEVTDGHIIAFFRELVRISRTGVLIYNAPGIGITMSASLIEKVADIAGVVGIKQGDLTPTVIDILANRLKGKLRLFCASDLAMLGPIAAGFDGVSSTNSCAFPELIHSIYEAAAGGDLVAATQMHRLWYPFREIARRFGQPQSTKAAMRVRGFKGGHVRKPLLDLDAAQYEQVGQVVAELTRDSNSNIQLPSR
jgi:dihydrodipicolinate synthase/N-acetylneuraminate lyase